MISRVNFPTLGLFSGSKSDGRLADRHADVRETISPIQQSVVPSDFPLLSDGGVSFHSKICRKLRLGARRELLFARGRSPRVIWRIKCIPTFLERFTVSLAIRRTQKAHEETELFTCCERVLEGPLNDEAMRTICDLHGEWRPLGNDWPLTCCASLFQSFLDIVKRSA